MKYGQLWRLSVVTTQAGEEPVTELLAARLGQPPCSYTDLETGRTIVSVYLLRKPDWSAATRAEFVRVLKEVTVGGSKKARAKARLTRLRTQQWAEAWKRHFKPLEIGKKLLIKPS